MVVSRRRQDGDPSRRDLELGRSMAVKLCTPDAPMTFPSRTQPFFTFFSPLIKTLIVIRAYKYCVFSPRLISVVLKLRYIQCLRLILGVDHDICWKDVNFSSDTVRFLLLFTSQTLEWSATVVMESSTFQKAYLNYINQFSVYNMYYNSLTFPNFSCRCFVILDSKPDLVLLRLSFVWIHLVGWVINW